MKHFLRFVCISFALSVIISQLSFAQCPIATAPSSDPPASIVRVQVLSFKPNSDMEGDDDYIPFYDNHADIFGKIKIDGESFDLPEVEDSDFPHWEVAFEKQVSASPVNIHIEMWENDNGLTGSNDNVDINPNAGSSGLDAEFDLCAMTVIIDGTNYSSQGVIEIKSGTGWNQGTIRLKIETADGRPMTTNDLALVETDMLQVLFHTQKLISGKPTIVMARVANNYATTINTNVRVIVTGAGVSKDDIFPMTIGAGEVKKEYYYLDDPIIFPEAGQQVGLRVFVEDAGNADINPKNCLVVNNANSNQIKWKTVQTPRNYEFMWAKVGTVMDAFNFTSDELLKSNMQLGGAYINGVYPLSSPDHYKSSIDILPPITGAYDFLATILSVFYIPLDNVTPYALVFELNGVANIAGCDRLMGVLPNKDWFERFDYTWLDDVTGLSLGEFAPRAVIFLPQYGEGANLGPAITLPAHEVGHTFGLSTDPTLKDSWVCDIDWPVLGHSACGFAGGFDEYKSATYPKGNPSNGFWIAQGGEPVEIDTLLNHEQCNSFCFMGGSPANAHLDWENKKKWIDAADYDQLVNKLQSKPDPEIIYISGIIAWNDQMYLGSVQHIGEGIPDRDSSFGTYAIRLLDEYGKTLKEVGLPVNWNSSDIDSQPRPVTFFALNVEYPPASKNLEIINRMSGKVLATKKISLHKPTVKLKLRSAFTTAQGEKIELDHCGHDQDHDKLEYFTLARNAKEEGWFPAEYWQSDRKTLLSTTSLEPGLYKIKVMASDGVHVSASNEVEVSVTMPGSNNDKK
ncbi:MAG: hypothetical protein IPO83_07455 [Chitinophagaceae bacterium]|nr:hypothetical protein [Chitinophagaceae bacterium]